MSESTGRAGGGLSLILFAYNEEENISPQILGLYIGIPRTEAEITHQPEDLTRVILFKKNLEKVCRDRSELIEQIQVTVRHEVGHHLGLSEEDLERLGLA
jgi:predicted Zn-dependent protease with MMP-like domain